MSSEKYEELEEDFHTHLEKLESALSKKLPTLTGELRKKELRNADKLIEDADSELSQMFDEAQSAPGTYRTALMSKSRGYKAQLDKLRKEYNKASVATGSNRSDLIGPPTVSYNEPDNTFRNRMVEGLEYLDRGSQSLARSERIAAETDGIGVQIIGDLDEQRESLLRTKDKLKETDSNLTRSRKLLGTMAIRVATNKLLLVVIIILELAILGAVVYIRFFKK